MKMALVDLAASYIGGFDVGYKSLIRGLLVSVQPMAPLGLFPPSNLLTQFPWP